jgi:hypothetical protein
MYFVALCISFVQTSRVADFGKRSNSCHTSAGGVYEKLMQLRYISVHRFILSSMMSMPFNVV